MKRLIVIPTWSGHFSHNRMFLENYKKYDVTVPVKFIVSDEHEKIELEKLIEDLREGLDVEIVQILTILKKYFENIDIDSIENIKKIYLRNSNITSYKHPYQAIKKIYSLRYFEYDQALLLDSESCLSKSTDVDTLFDEYFSDPYIFYSSHYEINVGLRKFTNASQTCLRNENLSVVRDMWFFENFYWMIDKKIVEEFFIVTEKKLGRTIFEEFIDNPGEIFEVISYYSFIFLNNSSYNYRILNFPKIISSYLKENTDLYMRGKSHRLAGFLEFLFENVNRENYSQVLKFIDDYKIRFARPESCDMSMYKKALKETEYLNLIVASESLPQILKFVNSED